ncbi:MAG: hypothetical protein WD077_10635 [Bacteroidia bacterium]
MNKILSAIVLVFAALNFAAAQHITDEKGRTYYDEEKTKPKEVFIYKEVHSFSSTNPKEMTTTQVKDGAYFLYREDDGSLEVEGHYTQDKKSGEWKYYDKEGKVIKTENYKNGELVE